MDYAIIYGRLVPAYEGTGCHYDDSFVWTDARVQPTEQECLDEWEVYQTEKAIEVNNEAAWEVYHDALNAGYTHTDTVTYFCDERATDDYVKIVTLFDLNPQEPVYLIIYNKTLHSMAYADFKVMAIAVGQHQYTLRQALWGSLL